MCACFAASAITFHGGTATTPDRCRGSRPLCPCAGVPGGAAPMTPPVPNNPITAPSSNKPIATRVPRNLPRLYMASSFPRGHNPRTYTHKQPHYTPTHNPGCSVPLTGCRGGAHDGGLGVSPSSL